MAALRSKAAECRLIYEKEYQREIDTIYVFKENHGDRYYLAWLSMSIHPQPANKKTLEDVGQACRKLAAQWRYLLELYELGALPSTSIGFQPSDDFFGGE